MEKINETFRFLLLSVQTVGFFFTEPTATERHAHNFIISLSFQVTGSS